MSVSAGSEPPSPLSELPAGLQQPLRHWLERFREHAPAGRLAFDEALERYPELLRLVACSEFAANTLVRDWQWFADLAARGGPRVAPAVEPEAPCPGDVEPTAAGEPGGTLRRCRQRALTHALWREFAGEAGLELTLQCQTEIADRLVAAAVAAAERHLLARFGEARDGSGRRLRLVVLAMGKLGGRDLNFSSDIDLIFLYPGDGETDGPRRLAAQDYFTRLARKVVSLLDEVTADGFVYRVDTRLRPFGDSGALVAGFSALESYLLRHGRGWERYAYVKARVVDTGVPDDIVDDLMHDVIHPFVYRRYLDYGVFESLRDMKALISAEAQRRGLQSNIKLGPGGIREIEFIVQSLQLVRGGADLKLRTPELRVALRQLADTRNLGAKSAARLAEAYRFLRRFENCLQALRDHQTHELPSGALDQARLALAMGAADWDELRGRLEQHRSAVAEEFSSVAFRGARETAHPDQADKLLSLWRSSASREEWTEGLAGLGYAAAPELAEQLVGFANSDSVRQIGRTGGKRLERFLPSLVESLKGREQPVPVLKRVLSILEQILRRSAYVALLNENPVVLDRLVSLCGKSAWLAEEIGRFPLLLDELLDPRIYQAALSREEMEQDLEQRLHGVEDSERQVEILGRFQRATLFRVAVADVSAALPVMKVSDRLTELAEIVLVRALSIAWSDLVAKYGNPVVRTEGGTRKAGIGVIAYGKFGGMELSYRSDLDLVFLHDSAGSDQTTDGNKPLDNGMFFVRLVRRLVHFLTAQTGSGTLYQVDMRLRPSGRSGLLVVGTDGFERYQEENAWTWEHQALLRSRPVAGSARVAREFERIRAETLRQRVRRERLRDDVSEMRAKMRRQLDRGRAGYFDLKQGQGGIGDIEFIVQYLVLQHAARNPAVIHYSDNIRQLGTLAASGCLPAGDVRRLQEIYKAYRLRLHHLALDERPPEVDAGEFTAERRCVGELWDRVLGP